MIYNGKHKQTNPNNTFRRPGQAQKYPTLHTLFLCLIAGLMGGFSIILISAGSANGASFDGTDPGGAGAGNCRSASSQCTQLIRFITEGISPHPTVAGSDNKVRIGQISAGESEKGNGQTYKLPDDLDRLSYAVAMAETGDCTKGMGVTKNNCFGVMHWPNGKRTGKVYDSKADSYADFKRIWQKSYGGFPTLAMARKWTGNDHPEKWLAIVRQYY